MKSIAIILTMSVFLTSCATGQHYYDQDRDGTRYYETKNGEKIHVTPDGIVYGACGQKLGVVKKGAKDWELSAYGVQPTDSRCINLFARDDTVSCWAYAYQIPAFIIAIPVVLAVLAGPDALKGIFCHPDCHVSSADRPSWSQEKTNQGPNRDRGGPDMEGPPSAGGPTSP